MREEVVWVAGKTSGEKETVGSTELKLTALVNELLK